MKKKGKLFLIPTVIADHSHDTVILPAVREIIKGLDYFLVENVRTSRRFISALKTGRVIEDIHFELLDKRVAAQQVKGLLEPALAGKDIGLMSEAGCPGIADPGAKAASLAHRLGIRVVPLVGPSAIFLALMSSGFNGQCFKFHGYLPIDRQKRRSKIKSLESESVKQDQSQIFMETPYRNEHLFKDLIDNCQNETQLCIARNITGENELIRAQTILEWKKNKPALDKQPTRFILYSGQKI